MKTESKKRPCFLDFNHTKPSLLENARLILPWSPLHDVPTIWETGTEGMFLFLVVSYLKIERALLLAERSVCVRVCKHGCGVKMFAFRALITQGRIWKGFRVQNSTSLLYLPIPPSVETWKIFTKKMCHFFSPKKNPYFEQHLFAKQELITRARRLVQEFATGKNFSFNQCHNKEFRVFSRESYFISAIENFFLYLHSLI